MRAKILMTLRDFNLDLNFWIAPSMQTAKFAHTATLLKCFLQTSSLRLSNSSKEAEYIQEVRFSRSVGANDVTARSKDHINFAKVAPIS